MTDQPKPEKPAESFRMNPVVDKLLAEKDSWRDLKYPLWIFGSFLVGLISLVVLAISIAKMLA